MPDDREAAAGNGPMPGGARRVTSSSDTLPPWNSAVMDDPPTVRSRNGGSERLRRPNLRRSLDMSRPEGNRSEALGREHPVRTERNDVE